MLPLSTDGVNQHVEQEHYESKPRQGRLNTRHVHFRTISDILRHRLYDITKEHIPQLAQFLLQCGGNRDYDSELRILSLNALNWTVQ